jgi:hypothetical protein
MFVTLIRYTGCMVGRHMKRVITIAVVGLITTQPFATVWASGEGTTGAEVLKIGVGARAIGMGEAYAAQADDVSSLYWNPGGLALMEERQASFMYDQMYQGLNYSNAAIGIPLENGAVGASLSYLGYGNIDGFDAQGNPTGSQSAHSAVGTLGGSWLGNQWSLGANVKGVQEKLADVSANGAAFDVGGTVIYPKPVLDGTLRFGIVERNMGTDMKFLQQSDPMPREFRVGVAAVQMMNKKLNLSMDYAIPKDDKSGVHAGVEYWLIPYFAIRTGYTTTDNEGSGIRAGAGIRVKGIDFDYAYASGGELGIVHRYELSFRFGEPRPILTAEEYQILKEAKAAMRQGRYDRAVLLFDSLIELEPHYKPARRLIKVAMASMEGQQKEMLAKQGKIYDESASQGAKKQTLPDLDDLEQLLNVGQTKSAGVIQPVPQGKEAPASLGGDNTGGQQQ